MQDSSSGHAAACIVYTAGNVRHSLNASQPLDSIENDIAQICRLDWILYWSRSSISVGGLMQPLIAGC